MVPFHFTVTYGDKKNFAAVIFYRCTLVSVHYKKIALTFI